MKLAQQKKPIKFQSITPKTLTYRKRKLHIKQDKQSAIFNNVQTQHQLYIKTHRNIPNYILQNTKNLHNYTDRLSQHNKTLDVTKIRSNHINIHPRRILQIKQQYSQLKRSQKIQLQAYMHRKTNKIDDNHMNHINKMNKTFMVHDVNLENQKKYSSQSKRQYHYQPYNHLRGTYSQIGKRAKLLKKEAYDRTFGPDISALTTNSSHMPHRNAINLNNNIDRSRDMYTSQDRRQLMQIKHKNKLQKIIKSLSLTNKANPSQYVDDNQMQTTMLTAITNMNKICNQGEQNRVKLLSLDDLKKINKQYFKDLLRHKQNRLNNRRSLIQQIDKQTNQ